MKSKLFLFIVVLSATISSCSDDNEAKKKGDADIVHEGEKWKVSSSDYMLIDQSTTSSQVIKSGSSATGSFYFVNGGIKGSFEIAVEGYNKEDAFNYTMDGEDISIVDVDQSVGTTTNQNVLVLSGQRTSDTEMSLDGTITKQSTTGQFVLTISVTLVKE